MTDFKFPRVRLALSAAKVASHLTRERIRRPVASTSADVPRSPADISPQWLSSALCRVPGTRVESVRVASESVGTSSRAGLTVGYNAAGTARALPEHLFAKTTTTMAQRLLLGAPGLLHNERDFIHLVRPHIQIETPAGYFASVDDRSWRSIGLFEDVSATKGAQFLSPSSTVSKDDALQLLETLAALHGWAWERTQLKASFAQPKNPAQYGAVLKTFVQLEKASGRAVRTLGDRLPRAVRDHHAQMWRAFNVSLDLASNRPATFLHGDTHIGNTYRTAAGRVGITDWQCSLFGHWSYDVSYLIASILTVEDRRRWEQELLAYYLDRLGEYGGSPASFNEAWLAYRQQPFYSYIIWLVTAVPGRLQPDMQQTSVSYPIVERIAQVIVDLESLSAVGVH
ncbi:aminoglycoside phosphotransferase family protein [Mycobacterium sp.]|uniref:aminoglycoside phosphotransferase family protein n=1 Tax=Mycobacterium sp. TaxID=1785 RepID=UPI003BAF2096